MNRQHGFSIIEFLVSILLLTIIFGIVIQLFVPIARSARVQSTNMQSQIEGIIGLETLRRDIVHAGVELPWNLPAGTTYSEFGSDPQKKYNDANGASSLPPRPLIAVDGTSTLTPPPVGVPLSDYLVIKSVPVADAIQTTAGSPAVTTVVNNTVIDRWTSVYSAPAVGTVRIWGSSERDLVTGDHVMVIAPADPTGAFMLVTDTSGGTPVFYTTVASSNPKIPSNFSPQATGPTKTQVYQAYGLTDTGTIPQMPFNRADYYISTNAAVRPTRCALGTTGNPGTGVLVKQVLKQDGNFADPLPLLDCVADFQIALGVDNQQNGVSQRNCLTNPTDAHLALTTVFLGAAPPNAAAIRSDFKEVRVYILAQEGGFDPTYNFRYPNNQIVVGEPDPKDCDLNGTASCNCTLGTDTVDNTLGQTFDMTKILNYQNYRWRVYKMIVRPEGLTQLATQ